MMKNTIFRQYDIRGIVGDELIIDEVYNLARSVAAYLVGQNGAVKKIAVGMDAREHSPAIKKELCRGLIDSGLDVIFVGMCTSPMVYFAANTMNVDAAIMVTASHNPKEYNGLKICLGTQSLWGNQILAISKLYNDKVYQESTTQGTYTEEPIKESYIAWHEEKFAHLQGMSLPVVIDCGNGSAGVVIPDIVQRMAWNNAQLLCAEVDGTFPNHEADPVKAKNMVDVQEVLKNSNATVGIGFDGDADRMGAMTKEGVLVPGDMLLAIFAQPMVEENPGMVVVYNVVCSSALEEALTLWGARSVVTAVGHSVIEENMHTHSALLGGETSCHFFFKDRHFGYDDGIYAMFRLFEILVQSKKSLTELLVPLPHKVTSPEYRLPCTEEMKYAMVNEIKGLFYQKKQFKISAIDGVKVTSDYGWGLIRASNTQPVLSIRFEADTEQDLHHIKEDFIVVLCNYFDQAYVREHLEMA
jgi:phosphomannomutase/phosphoglucomutase